MKGDPLITAFHLVALIILCITLYLLLFKEEVKQYFPRRYIPVAVILLIVYAVSNILEHSTLSDILDPFDEIISMLFFITLIFSAYSAAFHHELELKSELEENQKKSYQIFLEMFNTMPVLLVLQDLVTKKVNVNNTFEDTLGWTKFEIQDKVKEGFYEFLDVHEEYPTASSNQTNHGWSEFLVTTKYDTKRVQRWTHFRLSKEVRIGIGIDITEQKKIDIALQKEQRRFEFISKSTNDVLYEWDLQTDTVWWSQGWVTNFGFSEHEIGNSFKWLRTIIHPEDFEQLDNHYDAIKYSNLNSWYHAYRIIDSNGEIVHVRDKGYFIRDEKGKAIELVGALENITEEKLSKDLLQQSKERYEIFFLKNPMPLIIFDQETLKIIEANDAILDLYEYSKEELLSLIMYDLFDEDEWEHLKKRIQDYQGIPSPRQEWKHRTKSKDLLNVEITTNLIDYLGKQYRLAAIKDITKQKEAEAKVLSSFVEGENKERRRLAREIHDGITQYLAASKMNLNALKQKITPLSENEAELFENGLTYIKHAIEETRNISHNLMPTILEDYGLALAIKTLVEGFEKGSAITFNYFHNIDKIQLSGEMQTNMYRIAQECLNNIIKHSKADEVSIQLVFDNDELLLTVEDNGVGFDAQSDDYSTGLGLHGIKSRVLSMGGFFDIDSRMNEGSVLSICLPIQNGGDE